MTMHKKPEQKLAERIMLNRPRDDDRLMLSDAVLTAALDGSRPLGPNQRKALQQSPLTLRRFRHLALEARAHGVPTTQAIPLSPAANDPFWTGSSGMLRAADSGAALTELPTDDRYWVLHFVQNAAMHGIGSDLRSDSSWQVIITLDAAAPFAARLLQENVLLQVCDGRGAIILEGRLDADGEYEARWPFASDPAQHFQQCGAIFTVQPA